MITITEWNKETKSLVTQDYPPPPVQYIDITADNWMQYWGQEVEVTDFTCFVVVGILVGWDTTCNLPIARHNLRSLCTWEHARIKAPTEPYYYLKDEDVIKEGDEWTSGFNGGIYEKVETCIGRTVAEQRIIRQANLYTDRDFKVRRKR